MTVAYIVYAYSLNSRRFARFLHFVIEIILRVRKHSVVGFQLVTLVIGHKKDVLSKRPFVFVRIIFGSPFTNRFMAVR